jgi:hypothetical protein
MTLASGEEPNPVPGAERQRQPVGQPQVQLRQSGAGPHVPLRPVVQRRLGLHHVPRPGCCRARSTGKCTSLMPDQNPQSAHYTQ